MPPSGLYAIVRTPSAPPRRVASAPERREASSAATIAFDASAPELARIASSPSSSESSGWSESWARASDASASEVADRVARPGFAPLDERPGPEGCEHRRETEQHASHAREPAKDRPPSLLLLVLPAPLEDRLGEDVVEELVAGLSLAGRRRRNAPNDPARLAAAQLLQHLRDLRLAPPRPLRQIRGRMCDLRLRARDEEAEEIGCDRLLLRSEAGEGLQEVVLHDVFGPTECVEPGDRQLARPRVDRGSPEPLHDELEERKLDRLGAGNRCPGGAAALDACERARGRRVDDGVDQRRLDRVRRLLRRQAMVPLAYRPLDRLAGGRSAEVLHPHVVREQAWNAALEAVELGQGVFADREQEVHSEVGVVDKARELTEERSLTVLLRVVQEVVLELIEDDEQRPHVLRPRAERLLRRPTGSPPRNVLAPESLADRKTDCLHQRRKRIVPPGSERADREQRTPWTAHNALTRDQSQVVDHAGPEQ